MSYFLDMPNDPKSDRLLITWDEIGPPQHPPQPEDFSSYRPLNFIDGALANL